MERMAEEAARRKWPDRRRVSRGEEGDGEEEGFW